MVTLKVATESMNRAVQTLNKLTLSEEVVADLTQVVKFLSHQRTRQRREAGGFDYLNREEDVVENLREMGL